MKNLVFKRILSLALVLVLSFSMLVSVNFINASALTKTQAEKAMDDFLKVYFNNTNYSFYKFSDNPQNQGTKANETDFWLSALLWDTLNDAYEQTNDQKYADYIDKFYQYLHNGDHPYWDTNTWQENQYNDDLCWWAQASLRTYSINKDPKYLTLATQLFDKLYTFWDTTFRGGGIWWTQPTPTNNQKNVATNANAALIAARLSKILATDNPTLSAQYLEKANLIYNWTKTNLYRGNGYIIDNILNNGSNGGNGEERDWQFSYNFGLFAGASYELYTINNNPAYLADAKASLNWVIQYMTSDGCTIFDEGSGDAAGFKLVFMRMLALVSKTESEYVPFLKSNAYQALIHCRTSDGIVGSDLSAAPAATDSIISVSAACTPSFLFLASFDENETYETNFSGVYQAENSKKADVEVGSDQAGFTGRGFTKWWDADGPHRNDGYLNFNLNVPEAGLYKLDFTYFTRGDNTRRLSINGGAQAKIFFAASPSNSWTNLTHYAYLNKGDNSIRMTYFNPYNHPDDRDMDSWFFLDKLTVDLKNSYPIPVQNILTNGITTVVDYLEGWQGSNDNQYAEFTVTVPATGEYTLTMPYTNNSNTSSRELIVNGTSAAELISFPKVGPGWNNCSVVKVPNIFLKSGSNTIRIASNTAKDTAEYLNLMNKISLVLDKEYANGLNINNDSVSITPDSITTKTIISNLNATAQSCKVILAVYSSDNKLVSYTLGEKTVAPGATLEFDNKIENINTNLCSKYKIFVWDENAVPLVEPSHSFLTYN